MSLFCFCKIYTSQYAKIMSGIFYRSLNMSQRCPYLLMALMFYLPCICGSTTETTEVTTLNTTVTTSTSTVETTISEMITETTTDISTSTTLTTPDTSSESTTNPTTTETSISTMVDASHDLTSEQSTTASTTLLDAITDYLTSIETTTVTTTTSITDFTTNSDTITDYLTSAETTTDTASTSINDLTTMSDTTSDLSTKAETDLPSTFKDMNDTSSLTDTTETFSISDTSTSVPHIDNTSISTTASSSPESSPSTATIVGAVVGSILGALLLSAAIFLVWKCRHRLRSTTSGKGTQSFSYDELDVKDVRSVNETPYNELHVYNNISARPVSATRDSDYLNPVEILPGHSSHQVQSTSKIIPERTLSDAYSALRAPSVSIEDTYNALSNENPINHYESLNGLANKFSDPTGIYDQLQVTTDETQIYNRVDTIL
ncbi:serine-rich adhesin for platelets-like isoform X1 [Biomphalaria glabrata]|uniref:Serine-rich adhesin for platelets-like isoform X1 n=1 Tax=Biomphalaria glabrata TaxID=6526 RepID=A0A9W3BQ27_BIOGL|nr:serine-rich adhesin for platelets-like isoform X1 [Biomphalaria glabrata]